MILNLIVNALQAMSGVGGEGARELQISTGTADSDGVRGTVPGIRVRGCLAAIEPRAPVRCLLHDKS